MALFLEDFFQEMINRLSWIIFITAKKGFVSGNVTAITKAPYEICYIIGNRMKPFTDAEIMKEWFLNASNLEKFSDNNKNYKKQ